MKLSRTQKRSKLLLGGVHRARVGQAIAQFGDSWWTSADLEAAVKELPWSSVNKELVTLVDAGLVTRSDERNTDGRYSYQLVPVVGYWEAMQAIARDELPVQRRKVQILRLVPPGLDDDSVDGEGIDRA